MFNARAQRHLEHIEVDDSEPGAPPVTLQGQALQRWWGRCSRASPGAGSTAATRCGGWRLCCSKQGAVPRSSSNYLPSGTLRLDGRSSPDGAMHSVDTASSSTLRSPGRTGRIRLKASTPQTDSRPQPQPKTDTYEFLTGASITEADEEDIGWLAFSFVGQGLITELDGKVKQRARRRSWRRWHAAS